MTGVASQFGMDLGDAEKAVDFARSTIAVRVSGFHLFSMTDARSEDALIEELVSSIRFACFLEEHLGLSDVSFLDLGGGFGCPYAMPGRRPVYERLRPALEMELDMSIPGWRSASPTVAFESGRYLVGDAGELICWVTDVKTRDGTQYAVLDAGLNVLGGLSGLGRLLPLAAQPRVDGALEDAISVKLVGPLCTPVDVLNHGTAMGAMRPGDRVVFPNVGAYGATASLLAFLSRPGPVEAIMKGGVVVSATRVEVQRVSIESWKFPS
jgi:diaminopimelate decarboxylase